MDLERDGCPLGLVGVSATITNALLLLYLRLTGVSGVALEGSSTSTAARLEIGVQAVNDVGPSDFSTGGGAALELRAPIVG